MKICSVEGCKSKHYGRGFCRRHYQRQTHILKMKSDWVNLNEEKRKETLKKYHLSEKYKAVSEAYRSKLQTRHKKLVKAARDRGLACDISFSDYVDKFGDGKCSYCHNQVGPGTALDRINNQLGYHINNVRVCCENCNKLRQDRLTPYELEEVVKLLKLLRNKDDLWK